MLRIRSVVALVFAILFCLPSCKDLKVQSALDAALANSQAAQSSFHVLATAADAMLPFIPEATREQNAAILRGIRERGDVIFKAEQDAIRAGIVANSENIDLGQFESALILVLKDLLALSQSLHVLAPYQVPVQRQLTLLRSVDG